MTLPRIQDYLSNLQEAQRSPGNPTALDCALQHWHHCTDPPNFPPGCIVSPTGWRSHAISKIAWLWWKCFGIQTHWATQSSPASTGRQFSLFVRKKPFSRTSLIMFTTSRHLFVLVLALSSNCNASSPWEDVISFSLNLDEKTMFFASTYFAGPSVFLSLYDRNFISLLERFLVMLVWWSPSLNESPWILATKP